MGKNVIPFRRRKGGADSRRKGAADSERASRRGSRIRGQVGKQRYALDVNCQASILPPEPEPAGRLIETKFLRLRKPVAKGECIDGWRGGWGGGRERGEGL